MAAKLWLALVVYMSVLVVFALNAEIIGNFIAKKAK